MNVLYKYCDQLGAVKMLGALELKLPCISEVNDPLELLPFFYCPNDKNAMEAQCLRTFRSNRFGPSADWKQKLNEQFEKGEIQKNLIEGLRKLLDDLKQRSFLLSVSREARNTVMWAHYADKHKGAVIGIDFDNIYPGTNNVRNILMNHVTYSEQRLRVNVLDEMSPEAWLEKTLLTKSVDWSYEKEYRTAFFDKHLVHLSEKGLVSLKDFDGKETWFLRLNPESIREVIFGLFTEDSLKLAIRNLIKRPELKHVKLYQAKESETYTLDLIDLEFK